MDTNAILSDFERLKSACREMAGKKIIVGIVGEADSEVARTLVHTSEFRCRPRKAQRHCYKAGRQGSDR